MELSCVSQIADTAAEAIALLAKAGSTATEIWAGTPAHLDVTDAEQMAAVRAAIQAAGMRPYSAHCSFGDGADLSHPHEDQRRKAADRHIVEMRAAAELGCEALVVHPGVAYEESGKRAERLAAAADGMKQIMPAAEDVGINVAFENLPPGYVGDSIDELAGLVDGLDSSRAGFCIDTGHSHLSKIPPGDMVRAFGDRTFVIHWHDNDGTTDQHALPGNGAIDWPPFFDALDSIAFDRPITLEAVNREMLPAEYVRLAQLALDERRPMYL